LASSTVICKGHCLLFTSKAGSSSHHRVDEWPAPIMAIDLCFSAYTRANSVPVKVFQYQFLSCVLGNLRNLTEFVFLPTVIFRLDTAIIKSLKLLEGCALIPCCTDGRFYSRPSTKRVIVCIDVLDTSRILVGKPEGKRALRRPRFRWWTTLKLILERLDEMVWTGSIWLRIGPVKGSCEHGNEPSGSIIRWEVLEWLHNWRLFKKGSAP
jgi:hypothetical protein